MILGSGEGIRETIAQVHQGEAQTVFCPRIDSQFPWGMPHLPGEGPHTVGGCVAKDDGELPLRMASKGLRWKKERDCPSGVRARMR